MSGKRRAVCIITCILWAVPLICMAAGFILYKTDILIGLLEQDNQSAFLAVSVTAAAVLVIYAAQVIGYIIHVIRQKYWNDIGRKYFWIAAIISFGYFMIPIYWYRFILNKDSPYYR